MLASRDESEQVTQTKTRRPTWREEEVEDLPALRGNRSEGPGAEMEGQEQKWMFLA